MKKKVILLLALLMILLFTTNCFADNLDSASNYWIFNEDINITKEVPGDVYTMGMDVKVKDKVGGDVIALGETIDITSSELNGNIRCAAQTLNINSKNVKNITSFAQKINIGKDTTAKAIYVTGEEINFKGTCEGFYASGSTVIINGKVNGDVSVTCDELIIADNGEITGKINVSSPKEPIVNSNVSMNDINYTKIDNSTDESELKALVGFETVISIIASLLLGVIIYSIFKKFFIRSDELLVKEPLPIVLGGIASFILVPIVSILLFITIIGLPLGILSLIMYFIIVYLSPVIMGIILGRLMLKNKNPYFQIFIGVVVIRLLSLMPMIGGFIWVLSGMIVQGFIVYYMYQSIKYKENRI